MPFLVAKVGHKGMGCLVCGRVGGVPGPRCHTRSTFLDNLVPVPTHLDSLEHDSLLFFQSALVKS